MGFKQLLNRGSASESSSKMPKGPKLDWPYDHEERIVDDYGYYFASALSEWAAGTVEQMKKITNAKPEDVATVISSIDLHGICRELVASSNGELASYLSDHRYWGKLSPSYPMDKKTFLSIHHSSRDSDFFRSERIAYREQEMRRWVDENVPDAQQREFVALIDRYIARRSAVAAAADEFYRMSKEIGEALRKSQVIEAAQKLDRHAGATIEAEFELENAGQGRALVGALSAGLEEAYMQALDGRPALKELDLPSADLDS